MEKDNLCLPQSIKIKVVVFKLSQGAAPRKGVCDAHHSDFEIVAHKHEQAQDPNFYF